MTNENVEYINTLWLDKKSNKHRKENSKDWLKMIRTTINFYLLVILIFFKTCSGYSGTYQSNSYGSNYNSGYNSNNKYGTSYNSGYTSNLNANYRTGYNSGYTSNSNYGTNYNSGYNTLKSRYGNGNNINYGTSYNSGYGTNYNQGYGTNFKNGYATSYKPHFGTSYGKGYGTSYGKSSGTDYGANYAQNFYKTFPYFFLNPSAMGYNGLGFQSPMSAFGLPWSPFGSLPWSSGQFPSFSSYGYNNNVYGIHPASHYTGHYGVYQNYGYGYQRPSHFYGNRAKGFGQQLPFNRHVLPVPHPVPFPAQQPIILRRRPSLGERILDSPLLPAALIAAPLLLLAKGK